MYYIIWNEIFSFFPDRFEMYIAVAWFWNLYIIMWKWVWCDTVRRSDARHHILYDWELLFGVRSCAVGVNFCSFFQFFDKVLFHHDNYKYQVYYGYDTTLFIGYQHPITVYRTGLAVRCFGVEFNLCSFHKFLDEVLFHHDNYKCQVYRWTRHCSLVSSTPSQSIGLVFGCALFWCSVSSVFL